MSTAQSIPHPVVLDRESIGLLVRRFYEDVRADDLLGPLFETVLSERWDAHLPRMIEFWSTVMLHTRSFSGNVFGKHMALSGVTPLHFRRWLKLWIAHTDAMFEPATADELQRVSSGIARKLYSGYFGHPAGFDGLDADLRFGCRSTSR